MPPARRPQTDAAEALIAVAPLASRWIERLLAPTRPTINRLAVAHAARDRATHRYRIRARAAHRCLGPRRLTAPERPGRRWHARAPPRPRRPPPPATEPLGQRHTHQPLRASTAPAKRGYAARRPPTPRGRRPRPAPPPRRGSTRRHPTTTQTTTPAATTATTGLTSMAKGIPQRQQPAAGETPACSRGVRAISWRLERRACAAPVSGLLSLCRPCRHGRAASASGIGRLEPEAWPPPSAPDLVPAGS